ncbi:hypothetical protein HF998_15220, partial [Cellulomonas hominis]|nr:hypothetical protein [Cellulomonas hominis]
MTGTPDDDDLGIEIPDDLSGLDAAGSAPGEPPEPVVAVVVTQVAGARPLAAA